MTREDLQSLIDSGHEPTANVAHAIIAVAQVGPTTIEMSVDNVTLGMIARTLGITPETVEVWGGRRYDISLSFLEVDALVFARVPR